MNLKKMILMDHLDKAIKEAKKLAKTIDDPTHDIVHVQGVVDAALLLAREFPEVDKKFIEAAAWWHDAGRPKSNDWHAQISAKMASDFLIEIGADKEVAKQIALAIVDHSWNAPTPKTIEGRIIRDADKLEFISVKRWKHMVKHNRDEHIKEFIEVLPQIRDKILSLDASKSMFDQMFPIFKEFVMNNDWQGFDKVKELIENM
ncbi:HD domain protein [uncultured archaeon]|nr:HD domain protein [uncultured archaeon]